jgi:hypothetical protein
MTPKMVQFLSGLNIPQVCDSVIAAAECQPAIRRECDSNDPVGVRELVKFHIGQGVPQAGAFVSRTGQDVASIAREGDFMNLSRMPGGNIPQLNRPIGTATERILSIGRERSAAGGMKTL